MYSVSKIEVHRRSQSSSNSFPLKAFGEVTVLQLRGSQFQSFAPRKACPLAIKQLEMMADCRIIICNLYNNLSFK